MPMAVDRIDLHSVIERHKAAINDMFLKKKF